MIKNAISIHQLIKNYLKKIEKLEKIAIIKSIITIQQSHYRTVVRSP